MASTMFDLTVRELPGMAILDLQGEINGAAEAKLNEGYSQAEATQAQTVLLNFANVEYINSTGIALIVSLLSRARASGCKLLACGLSEHYVEIFNITRLADFMAVFADESAALEETQTAAAT